MKTTTGFLLPAFLVLGLALPASAGPGSFITTVQVTAGLSNAIGVTNAGDGSGRLFVVHQTGQIRIWNGSQLLATPFLNISSLTSACDPTNGCGERGLLGLAFHPSFETNGFFYVYYTRQSDGAIQVARYHATPGSNVADTPGTVLLTIPHPNNANHNGGQIAFGPDGYLYIGTGDGGGGGDPDENGQNINALLGKILRIDVDGDDFPGDAARNYAIPPTNPFAGATPGADEVWAYGLRNPWRFSFDRANGDLYIGDVGQSQWEEIDYQAAGTAGGRNYGWDCREGAHNYSDPNGDLNANCPVPSIDPVLEYDHSLGCSVTGGFVFRGLPAHTATGDYVYSDFCSGRIWLGSRSSGTWMSSQVLDTAFNVTSFGESEKGRLYFTTGSTLQWLAPYTFADVLPTHFAWAFVESIYAGGITSGCGGDNYCPESSITRAEMAVFLLRAKHGAAYAPPACTTPLFSDVPCTSTFAAWINQIAREGITTGCGGGNYCPNSAVTREQMAVFLLAAKEGTGYTPAACGAPTFADVPCSSSFAVWVNEIARRGVTGGCGSGNYCPTNPVTRGQIAVFLATTFGLATP